MRRNDPFKPLILLLLPLCLLVSCMPVTGRTDTATPFAPRPTATAALPTASPPPPPSPLATATSDPTPAPEPEDTDMVRVRDHIPGILIELKYATEDNFTGRALYDFTEAHLRYGTVKKLKSAQEELALMGYGIKIYDAFRPVQAQFILWEAAPVPGFVANPYNGFSSHSRGNTVDITLVRLDGAEALMPTPFDTNSPLADRDYSDVSEEARNNAVLLETVMVNNGFSAYWKEWWHFSDTVTYAVLEDFHP